MDIILSKSSKEPIYQQIQNQIKNAILNGSLSVGDVLPSIRKLSKDLSVSVITTKKAYRELEQEGYIETRLGMGSFVADRANKDAEWSHQQKHEIINQKIDHLIQESDLLDVSLVELSHLFQAKIKEREGK